MDESYIQFLRFMQRPIVLDTLVNVLLRTVPICMAVMIGMVIGWSWRPRWRGLVFLGLRNCVRFLWTAPPRFGVWRLWFVFKALSAFSVCRRLWAQFMVRTTVSEMASVLAVSRSILGIQLQLLLEGDGSRSGIFESEKDIVSEKDLEHLLHLLDGKVGDSTWQHMMERSTPNMIYHACRHEPEVGPVIYRSRTVFEDATPELVRDFFWDDDFRLQWDPMLAGYKTLEEFPQTGTMIAHWIKKFPFFCSDREYIIGRRIWESGKTYYCVTKGVPYASLPKNEKPRRVELYFSSWRIRAVESLKQDGQLSACEVTLVHYEDMGIPKDVAKLGVRHGMWGAVKKLHFGLRQYQNKRNSETALSRGALMARIITRVPSDENIELLGSDSSNGPGEGQEVEPAEAHRGIDWKWIAVGGAVAVFCGLRTGLIGKAVLVRAARRVPWK